MKLAIMFWYGPNLDNVDIFKKSIVTVCEDSVMITCLKSFYLVNESTINDTFLLSIFKNKPIIVSFIFMNIPEGMIGGIMVCHICQSVFL